MSNETQHDRPWSPLELLARDLEDQVKRFANYLRAYGLPEPTFGRDAPVTILPEKAPEGMVAAKAKILDNAMQIFHLASGPAEHLTHSMAGVSEVFMGDFLSASAVDSLTDLSSN